ncbi:membrane protein [Asticcacaulis sp. AC402]|uniref:membrane protein n=1 Tax=Asticcacaulis sp. AC402 TaxID=1282361 RepID=UPI0003C3FF0D|nr:membrane protein [Asticcacaulis sp. AC402]ESQ76376.1 membrane protein [Asticcacaulis sp. AC402]
MAGFLSNFRNVIVLSLLLAGLAMAGIYWASDANAVMFAIAALRWAHVVCGILWIGLLYYFNFVQIRIMPNVPAELKAGITKYIAPEALFWFRYAALATVVIGLFLAWHRGSIYFSETLSLGFAGGYSAGDIGFAFIGAGMWLGIIMMFNVWGFIWPAQKIALGIKDGTAEQKAAAAKKAMIVSRINTLLSLPMLVTMTMYQTLFSG